MKTHLEDTQEKTPKCRILTFIHNLILLIFAEIKLDLVLSLFNKKKKKKTFRTIRQIVNNEIVEEEEEENYNKRQKCENWVLKILYVRQLWKEWKWNQKVCMWQFRSLWLCDKLERLRIQEKKKIKERKLTSLLVSSISTKVDRWLKIKREHKLPELWYCI